MITHTVFVGDALGCMRNIPDGYVQCVATSPPYYGLRDYGVEGQIGLEQSPTEYVEQLVVVFREVRRVLRDDGTLWLNLGDSYAGAGAGGGGNRKGNEHGQHDAFVGKGVRGHVPAGLKPKDLIGIPWMVAFALRDDGWYLRKDIIWHKPNTMPENVKDRPTSAHEYVFLLSKSPRYYYDRIKILEPYTEPLNRWGGEALTANGVSEWDTGTQQKRYRDRNMRPDPRGRNRRSVWSINTQPYRGAHFATYPPKLIEPCILAGCPEEGIVFDPFWGAGTTSLVAGRLRRSSIGIELNQASVELGISRCAKENIHVEMR